MKLKTFNTIDIIIDNPNSWMWEYISILENALTSFTKNIRIFKNIKDIQDGEILFILSCDKILKLIDLNKHKNNIVIHASDLPKGKGWSPWSWEVEQDAKFLTLTLFEAELKLDSGYWYIKDILNLNGDELIDDIRKLLAIKEFDMIKTYLLNYPMKLNKQLGEESFYEKRSSKNQELDINKSIAEQFNKLRVCDNKYYPAHFYLNNKKYVIKIEKIDND